MSYDIDDLLRKAYTMGASDLHLTVNAKPIFRLNGNLITVDELSLTSADTEAMAKKIIPQGEWERFVNSGDMDFPYDIANVSRFRVNAYLQKQNISIVARVIPTNVPTLEQLGMPEVLKQLALKPQGLILVTGPTGSGKTTTLAAMIDYINRNDKKHIITLEDPVEYVHQHQKSIVNQREIGSDTKSFAKGLRAALRQDPDIILVGEMRDYETISTAITAAETGHLVLATLHTNSAAQTIYRVIDVFPPHQQAQIRVQLASALAGIVSQRLIPNVEATGRVAATEILINLPSVANLIRNEKIDQINNILQTNRAKGMHTLEMSIRELLKRNAVNIEFARNYLSDAGE